ncbi:AAA family ATPase [Lutimaribacter marinistellae]|uniref:AAA family ATPase n=1 Tax=Lutimaribacter marinistellae TaxID=1820329 RepID=A0ABV7TGZ8_9RHOB
MICGKMASGKSTLAARLASAEGAVLISEDAWLAALFSEDMHSGADYLRCAAKLRQAMGPHVTALLRVGVPVVLDYPANTVEQREWMRGLVAGTGADNRLHLLMTPDALCLERLRARNAAGDHPFAPTEEQFHRFAKHFVPPREAEGFTIVTHEVD